MTKTYQLDGLSKEDCELILSCLKDRGQAVDHLINKVVEISEVATLNNKSVRLQVGKRYKTRGGNIAVIDSCDSTVGVTYPFAGRILLPKEEGGVLNETWTIDGSALVCFKDNDDLVKEVL